MGDRRQFLDDLKNGHDLRTEFPFALEAGGGRLVRPRPAQNGKAMLGLCPFHPRSSGTPSLVAYRTSYKCYGGCAGEWWEHGDIFTLIMKLENLNFMEAVEHLTKHSNHPILNRAAEMLPTLPPEQVDPLEPLAPSTMEDYFDPLTEKDAALLLKMGFEMPTLEWAGIRLLYKNVFAFPIYEQEELMNVKLYEPQRPEWKWLPFFTNRRKQLYLADEALRMNLGYVVLYESEKDALLSRQLGVPSVATGGAKVWNRHFTEQLLPFDLLLGMKDLDEAGEGWSAMIRRHMPRFTEVDWRLLDPTLPQGFDLGKYILKGGNAQQYLDLLRAGQEGRFLYQGL